MATTTTAASKKRKLAAKPKTKPKAPRKVTHVAVPQWNDDRDYAVLHEHLSGIVAQIKGPLFTTDVEHLWGAFYGALPAERRQHYNCRTCRKFVERFGGLVAIVEGDAVPVFWPQMLHTLGAPYFDAAILAARRHVDKARINGVFLCEDRIWGIDSNESKKAANGVWQHMHAVPRQDQQFKPTALLNASQVMAEKREEYGMLCRGLAEFPIETVRKAHALLTTGGLYRSEKCIGAAEWLLKLHEAREASRNTRTKENVTWTAVASAPAGWCHVRTSMIGTLLEDVAAGKSAAEIKRSFDAKMSPLQYQRPSAAPTDGQLAAAEKVIEKLAAADALDRRYARLEDVIQNAFWTPKSEQATVLGGVFGHLRHQAHRYPLDMPSQVVTWVKFARDVLPTAERIEYKTTYAQAGFFAFVTATNPDAPPILQWDTEAKRNPVNWYLYHGGSVAGHWNLPIGYVDVTAITTQPSEWGKPLEHQGRGAYLILNGARDTHPAQAGLALFPEVLKSEFHGIRASLEALSRSRKLGGALEASACGVCVQDKATGQIVELRVTSRGVRSTYRVDRFE